MWYGGYGGYGCGEFGWHSLLFFLLVIATIFVFIGCDGRRGRGADAEGEAV